MHLYKTFVGYNICTMFDQRRGRCADVVQMLYKCFVFAGTSRELWQQRSRLVVDEDDNGKFRFESVKTR